VEEGELAMTPRRTGPRVGEGNLFPSLARASRTRVTLVVGLVVLHNLYPITPRKIGSYNVKMSFFGFFF
jgi:hypothetical protein